ncbi:LOW QUALITY PROTEIN: prominin-like protein [Choristoneura fumiferana]|uniref:LOW QUALITY PROTEIN: prominin-like protein n=1 Tax=Choristoneura fumiferana TaxID=7141 RepID=UPI003D154CCD
MWRTCLALAALAGTGWAGAPAGESFLTNISRTLHSEMADVLQMAHVEYSTPVINVTYVATVEFDMRAMGPLYNHTGLVIDVIAKKQAYPEGIVSVSDGNLEFASARENWRVLLAHYAGPAALLVVAALLAPALPLAGLFWCCCYWCRAGRRRRPFDRKYDACLKGLLAILLIALLTLFLFGVVCAFATDEQLERSTSEAPGALRAGLRDARTFLNATQAHMRWLLVVNYNELERKLDALLTSSGLTVSVHLGEFSRAVSVTTLNKMVQQLDAVQADLRTVHNVTSVLRYNAERLNTGLRKVKAQLLQTLAKCEQPQCLRLQEKYKIGQLDTEIQYSQMPDVSELLSNVTALLDSNIKAEVAEGQQVFASIQREIQRSVDQHIPAVKQAVAATGRRLAAVADEITAQAGNASKKLQEQEAAADTLQEWHAQYGPYRRHATRAAAAALLLITCLMTWGLVCGVCGKRPDVYGASDCCNKGAGSRCLLCGMGVMFIVGGISAVVLVVYFVVGVASQRFICDPLTEPQGNRLFDDLEKMVDLERAMFNERRDPDFNMSRVLTYCHRNHSLMETLELDRLYDLEGLRTSVAEEVSRRAAALRPAFPASRPLSILKPRAREKLEKLAQTGLSDFDFDRILHALETNMTNLSLDSLSAQLEATAGSLVSRAGFARVSMELRDAAAMLTAYHADIVTPMLDHTRKLNITAMNLRDGLRFNHSSFNDAIRYLIHETSQAEVFLNTQGPDLIQSLTQDFASVVAQMLDSYLQLVISAARHDVGRCGPLSNAFNATRDAACHKMLMPTNGYWMAVSWCLVLFVPLLVVAARLARLYLHVDAYPGPLVEAEYLYDAFADRDNVPLANAYKAEKRAGREGRRGGGAGRGGARDEARAPVVAPPLDAHHARRYNDMAPKHWEEGPPRYHGPTEYERPPPYYYPGPNDRQ